MRTHIIAVAAATLLALSVPVASLSAGSASAESLPWQKSGKKPVYLPDDPYAAEGDGGASDYSPEPLPGAGGSAASSSDYGGYDEPATPRQLPKSTSPAYVDDTNYDEQPEVSVVRSDGYSRDYEMGEITAAGHRFFGNLSSDLASVIEYAFRRSGRPNGYILGEEGGGAFVAGLRYGEGRLYTKDAGERRVYWQGPSIGYDFGAEGSRTMILVYNLRSPDDIFANFGGLSGSAYLVGGVGITYLTDGKVTTAPIRSGLGLRLGANVGYLKYTPSPTWNPF